MTRTISFVVEGLPIAQGSKNCRCQGGRGVMWNVNDKALREWRKDVALTAMQHRVTWIRQSPLCVRLLFQLPTPKHAHAGDFAPVRPDVDKLARAILDSLTDGKVLVDDAQVVDLRIRKRYGQPGVAIYIDDIHHHYERQPA